jgi:hypothetical protein
MDLLLDFELEPLLNFTLVAGKERIKWSAEDVIYNELWDRIDEMGLDGRELLYKDECGSMINLVGEADLQLLVRTNPQGLVFYLSTD